MKKTLLLMLTVCLICSLSIMQTMAISTDQVQKSLESVLNDFPVGSYFTTDGKNGSPGELTKIMQARGLDKSGYDVSYTCVGFAKYVWAKVFNHTITAAYRTEYSSGRAGSRDTWKDAAVGDLVYFYKNSDLKTHKSAAGGFVRDPYVHAAIVWSISDSGITLYDCNFDGTNQIKLYTASFGGYGWPKSYCRLYHAIDYDNTPVPTIIVTFAPNGGNVSPQTKTVVQGGTLDSLPIPTRPGYTFSHWSTAKEGSGAALMEDNYKWMVFDRDTTLYAVWNDASAGSSNIKDIVNEMTDRLTDAIEISFLNLPVNDLPDGLYELSPLCAPGSRLDVAGADWRDNANVQIHESNGTQAQQWEFTNLQNGYYRMICKASGKALDVSQAGTEPGTNVQQFTPNNTAAQQWSLYNAGDGYYYLVPCVNTKLCLDVSGAGNENGTNVQVYTANKTDAQKWRLTAVISSTDSHSEAPNQEPAGYWGTWSKWSPDPAYESDTREVEERQVKVSDGYTEYRYGRYVDGTGKHAGWCETYLAGMGYSGMTTKYSDWTTSRYSAKEKDWTCGFCRGNHVGVDHYSSDGRAWWKEYVSPRSGNFFWEESRTIDAQYETQYRYRDWIDN